MHVNDLTVSVWNRFHSFPLISGLTRGGFSVRALGTTRRTPECARYECCWSAALATQAGFRMPTLRIRLLEFALARYEAFAARRVFDTGCFWGWSGHHLAAFRRCKEAGIPVILETGSTHADHAEEVNRGEFLARGLHVTDVTPAHRIEKMRAEYAIADWICVPSQFVAKTFLERGVPSERIRVTPYGADIAFWSGAERNRIHGPTCIVYTGAIMLRKGFWYLIEAWRRSALKDAELLLIGPVSPECEPMMRELPSGVRYLGYMGHGELRDLYAHADAYVLPSLEEGMARSILEAMAAGLPVIVTEETGITDIMRADEDGWVVPSRNVEALAQAFREVAASREGACARGRSARERVRPFTWERYGDEAAAFATRIFGGARRHISED